MTVKSADPLHDDRRPIPSPMFGTMIGRPELTGAPAGEMDIEMNRVEWKHHQWTARIKHIFLGQLLAGLLCLTGVCSRNLVELGISAPSCQNAANYLVMAIICSPPLIRRRSANRYGAFLEQSGRSEGSGAARTERVAWSLGRWALVAVCDLEANYLAVKAYSLTTFSSAQLLDCAVLPCVIVLSTRILGHRYRLGHIGCAGLTLLGAVLMVITDWDGLAFGENTIEPDSVAESLAEDSHIGLQPNKSDGLRRTLGDILCLLSAALYACSNVGQEAGLMYAADGVRAATADWLGVLGLIGTPLSVLQIALFEREELEQLFGQQQEENAAPSLATFSKYVLRWLWLLLYAVALFSFYCIAPRLLAAKGAVFFNLSLVTADGYAVVASLLLFEEATTVFRPIYMVGLVLATGGIIVYNLQAPPDLADGCRQRADFAHQSRSTPNLRRPRNYSQVPAVEDGDGDLAP